MTLAGTKGDLAGMRDALSLGVRSIGIFSVFFSGVLFVLAHPLLITLVPTLNADEARLGAPILRVLALGVVALGGNVMVKRMFFALEDGRGVFLVQIAATTTLIAILWLASLGLAPTYWALAAAAAQAISLWVSVLLRVKGMRRRLGGIDGHRVLRLHVRAGVAMLFASAGGFVALWAMPFDPESAAWLPAALATSVAGLAMIVIYLGGLKLLRVDAVNEALASVLRNSNATSGGSCATRPSRAEAPSPTPHT
jgi:putative peptidoglycan lipid II flippase